VKYVEWFARYVMVGAFVGGGIGECFGSVAMGDRIGGCVGIAIGIFQIARGAV
jgi:uncharacterized membrane protein